MKPEGITQYSNGIFIDICPSQNEIYHINNLCKIGLSVQKRGNIVFTLMLYFKESYYYFSYQRSHLLEENDRLSKQLHKLNLYLAKKESKSIRMFTNYLCRNNMVMFHLNTRNNNNLSSLQIRVYLQRSLNLCTPTQLLNLHHFQRFRELFPYLPPIIIR